MKMPSFKSMVAGLLCTALVFTATACSRNKPESESSEGSSSSSSSSSSSTLEDYPFVNALPKAGIIAPASKIPTFELTTKVSEAFAVNDDVKGYLYIPDTTVDEPVPQSLKNNNVYLRLNWKGVSEWNGCFWADYRSKIGAREELAQNLIIYGHNLVTYDDPNGLKFAQLFKFLDQDFAEAHPYIYFSTEEEDFVYQVFAAFYTEAAAYKKGNLQTFYNRPAFSSEEEMQFLLDEVKQRSEYIYPVEVTTKDKLLTLSVCTYHFTSDIHAAEAYRYSVMAKLLPKNAVGKETIKLEKNPNPKPPQV